MSASTNCRKKRRGNQAMSPFCQKEVSIALDTPESAERLKREKETGIGYQVVAVKLKDGRCFDQVSPERDASFRFGLRSYPYRT